MRPLEHLYSVRCYSTCSLAKTVIDCFAHCMAVFCRTLRLKDLFGPLLLVCVFVVVCRHWLVAFECQIKTHDVCLPKAAVAVENSPSSPVASAVEQEKRESKKEVEGMCWWFTENPPTKVTLLLVYLLGILFLVFTLASFFLLMWYFLWVCGFYQLLDVCCNQSCCCFSQLSVYGLMEESVACEAVMITT